MRTGLVERLRYVVLVRRPAPALAAQQQVLDVLSRLVRHSVAVARALCSERSFDELVRHLLACALPADLPLALSSSVSSSGPRPDEHLMFFH